MKTILFTLCLIGLSAWMLPAQNPRNVLIYNLTSTDCGPCSCMDSILRVKVMAEFPQTIILALHGIGSVFGRYQGDSARNYFNASYEPSGFIDGLGYDVPHLAVNDTVASRYAHSPEAPVKIDIVSKTWDPVSRKVNLTLQATNIAADMQGPFWFNLVVTESNLKHTHRTFTGCATPDVHGLPLRENYFNHWVVRKMEYWSRGDSLIGPAWAAQQSVTRTCSVAIDTAWIPENCNIVVTIYKKADSLYKSNIQQAIRQSVTGGAGTVEKPPTTDAIMLIYPNPSKGLVNIHFSVSGESSCSLKIFDLAGKAVQTIVDYRVNPGLYNAEIETESLPPGMYSCVLTTSSGQYRQSIIVR